MFFVDAFSLRTWTFMVRDGRAVSRMDIGSCILGIILLNSTIHLPLLWVRPKCWAEYKGLLESPLSGSCVEALQRHYRCLRRALIVFTEDYSCSCELPRRRQLTSYSCVRRAVLKNVDGTKQESYLPKANPSTVSSLEIRGAGLEAKAFRSEGCLSHGRGMIWQFPYIGSPFPGCPCNKNPAIWGL